MTPDTESYYRQTDPTLICTAYNSNAESNHESRQTLHHALSPLGEYPNATSCGVRLKGATTQASNGATTDPLLFKYQ